jgi:hypothetical protein
MCDKGPLILAAALFFFLPCAAHGAPNSPAAPTRQNQLVLAQNAAVTASPAVQYAPQALIWLFDDPADSSAGTVEASSGQQQANTPAPFDLRNVFGDLLICLLCLISAVSAFLVWNNRHTEKLWLWLGLLLSLQFLVSVFGIADYAVSPSSVSGTDIVLNGILRPAGLVLWTWFWWDWFQLKHRQWIPIATSILTGVFLIAFGAITFFVPDIGASFAQQVVYSDGAPLCLVAVASLLLLLYFASTGGHDFELPVEATPILILFCTPFVHVLFNLLTLPYVYHPLGLGLTVGNCLMLVALLATLALAIARFVRLRFREEVTLQCDNTELELARELQHRILLSEDIHLPDFSVETAYRPCRSVGGDFYQTFVGIDGSLLIVMGDVSGRDATSALLVSVLIGALCTKASDTFDPVTILQTLNTRLARRTDGNYATCMTALLNRDGLLRIANAGHIPPFLNGEYLDIEGSLPLGFAGKLDPTLCNVQLYPGDHVTFITNGVVEARNEEGEIYGFDRAAVISLESIEEIAHSAQSFGQTDDITVLRVNYTGSLLDTTPNLSHQHASPYGSARAY